jgi:spore germination protein KC
MKKRIVIMTLLCSLPLATGCWDRTEMNDLALVMAAGYDLTDEGELRTTLQIALPSGGQEGKKNSGGDKKPFLVQSMTGDTVHDSQVKIQERMSRELYEGHRRVIVIGEKLARHGIKNLLDQFSRDPHSRFRSYIVIAKGMEARELLDKPYPFERVPAEAMRELEKSRAGFESTLRDYMIENSIAGVEPIMGAIELISESSDSEQSKDQNETFHLAGTGVFNKLKLIGYLDDRETRGLLWLRGERPRGIFTADIPQVHGRVSVEMKREKSKLQAHVENGKVHLLVHIDAEAAVHENATSLDLSVPASLDTVEAAITQTICKRVRNVVTKAQTEFGQDIFGFGRELHRHDPAQWELVRDSWNEKFSEADLQPDVSLRLIQMGMSRAPLQTSGEVKTEK